MKRKLINIAATSTLLGIAIFGVYTQSEEETVQKHLSFSMTSIKQSVLLLEPIALQFVISNQTDKSLNLKGGVNLNSLKLTVRKPNGETVVPQQLSYLSGQRGNARLSKTFKANETLNWTETLEFRLKDYFGEIGEYELQASYQNGDQTLTTEWVTLYVEHPQGQDLFAFERLKATDGPLDGVFTLGTIRNRLAFVEAFPNSRYADYAMSQSSF